jgi:hypothetical protein
MARDVPPVGPEAKRRRCYATERRRHGRGVSAAAWRPALPPDLSVGNFQSGGRLAEHTTSLCRTVTLNNGFGFESLKIRFLHLGVYAPDF